MKKCGFTLRQVGLVFIGLDIRAFLNVTSHYPSLIPTTPPRSFVPHHYTLNENKYDYRNEPSSQSSKSHPASTVTNPTNSPTDGGGSTDALMQVMNKWQVIEDENIKQVGRSMFPS